jgi:metal-responsive CopG/Arc/MetJ family transcriptional regulator
VDDGPGQRWVRIPIGFPTELYEWLRETAHRRRTKMAELVRQAVREYQARLERELELPLNREEEQ